MTSFTLPPAAEPKRTVRPRAIAAIALLLAGLIVAVAMIALDLSDRPPPPRDWSALLARTRVAAASPVVENITPSAVLAVSAMQAKEINAQIPMTRDFVPAAAIFAPRFAALDFERSVDCLSAAVYYEAASESDDGERAVAQVVLNRVRHPAFPHSVCGVVFQGSEKRTGCQFSFTCDGSLHRVASRDGWARARRIAMAALGGSVYIPAGWATHYHADYVVPAWATQLTKVAVVGAHIFYRWPEAQGRPSAFTAHYSGVEDESPLLAAKATPPAEATPEAAGGATPAVVPDIAVRTAIRTLASPDQARQVVPDRLAIRPDRPAAAVPDATPTPTTAPPTTAPPSGTSATAIKRTQ